MGDQGYDSNKIREMLAQQSIPPCIPPPSLPQETSPLQQEAGSQVSQIEMLFSRQKDWRRLATRYDRCAHVFRSAILLAATVLFWHGS